MSYAVPRRPAGPRLLGLPGVLAALLSAAGFLPRAHPVDFVLQSPQVIQEGQVAVGLDQSFSIEVSIRNDQADPGSAIQGFQMAIQHNPEFIEYVSTTWDGTDLDSSDLRDGAGPEFFEARETREGGTGITLGVVFELQELNFLLPDGNHLVARLDYKAIQSTPEGQTTPLAFADSLGVPPIENKYTTRSGETLAPSEKKDLTVFVGGEVTYSVNFTTSTENVDPGGELKLPIQIRNTPLPVFGFSFGVKHDATRLSVKEVTPAEGLTSVIGEIPGDYPFFALNTSPEGGDGFTVALILSQSDPSVFLDPTKSPHHVFDVTYSVVSPSQAITSVGITDDLGRPTVPVVLDLFGTAQPPSLPSPPPPTAVTVNIGGSAGAPFARGDLDQDGTVNITDAINILNFLFNAERIKENPAVQETVTSCLVVLNVDGSTIEGKETRSSIDISDAIRLLDYLFLSGSDPPPPFGACDFPPNEVAADAICATFKCPP